MKFKNQYIIYFKGLKEGIHDFEYKIEKPFFEEYMNLDIFDGNVGVQVKLNKENNFMELDVDLSGNIQVQCDRCLTYFDLPIAFTGHLMVKFNEKQQESYEEVMILHPEDNQLDLKHYLYECISLSVPLRKVHPDMPDGRSGCDPEMLKLLMKHLISE
ncbi:MAG: DUF177 domain-containing protein [Bacteroidales bacterium]|nr:DUF177 domain-containing protein [Bacteroidales bacterium]